MIRVEDFGTINPCSEANTGFAFGLTIGRSVAAIRRMADLIEDGTLCLQTVEINQTAAYDDFAHQQFVLKFAERLRISDKP